MSAIRVVAAVIEQDGAVLLGRRPVEKRHGDLWEFPGGKLDEDETPADAARRELDEELGLTVLSVGERLHAVEDPASPFVIEFYPVEAEGEPRALEHSQIAWVPIPELRRRALAPADLSFALWYEGYANERR